MLRRVLLAALCAAAVSSDVGAHENFFVHPFGISDDALSVTAPNRDSAYWDLRTFFNKSPDDAPGYDPGALFPKSHLCKIGTQGTIDEDDTFQRYNWFPYLNHFWKPWAPVGGTFNALEYGPQLFDEAVMHFADRQASGPLAVDIDRRVG